MITATINGKTVTFETTVTVAEYLTQKNLKPLMVVVEFNGAILSRDVFSDVSIEDGDELEIVQMMAGG